MLKRKEFLNKLTNKLIKNIKTNYYNQDNSVTKYIKLNELNLNKYNNKWDYNQILYNFNNNNLLNNLKLKYIIRNFCKYILNHKMLSLTDSSNINKMNNKMNNKINITDIKNKSIKNLNILYKEPIIKINEKSINGTNKLFIEIIIFIYKPKPYKFKILNLLNKTNNSNILVYKIINILLSTSLNKLLKFNNNYLYNTQLNKNSYNNNNINVINNMNIGEIKIKPIILTYDYLDSEIYSKSITKHLSKYPALNKIYKHKYSQKVLHEYIFKKITNKLKIDEILLLLTKNNIQNNINKEEINELMNKILNKNLIINNNLLYQTIIGNNWKFRGKSFKGESNGRALKHYSNNGYFKFYNPHVYNKSLKLNNYSANWSQSQTNNINKNGKYNIKVKLSHF